VSINSRWGSHPSFYSSPEIIIIEIDIKLFFVQPPKPSLTVGGKNFAIFEPLTHEHPAATVPKNHQE